MSGACRSYPESERANGGGQGGLARLGWVRAREWVLTEIEKNSSHIELASRPLQCSQQAEEENGRRSTKNVTACVSWSWCRVQAGLCMARAKRGTYGQRERRARRKAGALTSGGGCDTRSADAAGGALAGQHCTGCSSRRCQGARHPKPGCPGEQGKSAAPRECRAAVSMGVNI